MAEETFNVAFACLIQSAKGTPNIDAQWSTSAVGEADGAVLGDRDSGDAASGIDLPTFERVDLPSADAGLTKTGSSFLRVDVTGLAITIALKGNGVLSTPSAGQAKPVTGIDALLQSAGLAGANGSAPAYVYTPTDTEKYLTVCLWAGTNRFIFQDCIAEPTLTPEPGGACKLSFAITVGSHDPATQKFAGVTFPTFTYGAQASLAAPVVKEVDHTLGTLRSFSELEVSIARDTEETPDANSTTGITARQTARTVQVTGTIYVDPADGDYDYTNVVGGGPTDDMTFHIGEAAGAGVALNSVAVVLGNLQHKAAKPNRLASFSVFEISDAQAQGATSGSEFSLTYL
jgi:hypothetical protein